MLTCLGLAAIDCGQLGACRARVHSALETLALVDQALGLSNENQDGVATVTISSVSSRGGGEGAKAKQTGDAFGDAGSVAHRKASLQLYLHALEEVAARSEEPLDWEVLKACSMEVSSGAKLAGWLPCGKHVDA